MGQGHDFWVPIAMVMAGCGGCRYRSALPAPDFVESEVGRDRETHEAETDGCEKFHHGSLVSPWERFLPL